ncbi:hypothetical protein ACLX1H_006337 [Fusarium chlamydosporum]
MQESEPEPEGTYSYLSPEEAMRPYVWQGWQSYNPEETADPNHQSADPTFAELADVADVAEDGPFSEVDPADDGDIPSEIPETANADHFNLDLIFQRMDQIGLEENRRTKPT